MEFSVPGFIKRYCTPNALLTLTEYLVDYASTEVQQKGYTLINKTLEELNGHQNTDEIKRRIERIKEGERDLYF